MKGQRNSTEGKAKSRGGTIGAPQTPRGYSPWKSHFSSPCGTLVAGTTETVTTETAGARPGDTGPTREPSPLRASSQPEGSFLSPVLTCQVSLPRHCPPPFPTPSGTQVGERAELARAQRRRTAGRSPCVVAAILGLRSAAEAGTTRAIPSEGVARNRVREEDSAEARKPRRLGPKLYSEPATII